MTGKHRPRAEDRRFLTLTKAQSDALLRILSKNTDGCISWQLIHSSRVFQNVSYDALRAEGKAILRRLKKRSDQSKTSTNGTWSYEELSRQIISLKRICKKKDLQIKKYKSQIATSL